MSELDAVMLEAIRFRSAQPAGNVTMAQRDRAWLLDRYDALRNAVDVVLEAVAAGADGYEVRPELDALAEVAALPAARPGRRLRDSGTLR